MFKTQYPYFLNHVNILRCLILALYIPDIIVYGAFAICFWGAGKNRLPKRISLLIVDAKKNSNWICALIEFWPANDSKKLMCKNSQLLKVDFYVDD